ncbi:MAG: hypothetical protein IPF50_02960 [Proteobacteria bacterium]|nr:hypothetical protein [Pseudomonadota bacterium]
MVEVEGSGLDISCNMPVWEGMKVYTESEAVKEQRKLIMQMITLNHPVDCGICDKAGECTLQDYHFAYNGERSISHDAKVRSTKFHNLSNRILLDNERCILCLRCTRFTHEVSKSMALGVERRGDHSNIRPAQDQAAERRPVFRQHHRPVPGRRAAVARLPAQGARLVPAGDAVGLSRMRPRLHRSGLAPQAGMATPGTGPAAEHEHRARHAARQPGRQRAVDLQQGPRPGARVRARPRRRADAEGGQVVPGRAGDARRLISAARRPVALVSNWGSNEELAAFSDHLGERSTAA